MRIIKYYCETFDNKTNNYSQSKMMYEMCNKLIGEEFFPNINIINSLYLNLLEI